MAERPDSLLHPTRGYAANRIARDLGVSTEGRLRELESRVETLRQSLAHDLKTFRGIRIGDDGHLITPDDSGYMHFWPKEGSGLSISVNPNAMRHGAEWDAAGEDCECCSEESWGNATVTVTDQNLPGACAGGCLSGTVSFVEETCTPVIRLFLDYSCLCDCCGGGGGGGGGG